MSIPSHPTPYPDLNDVLQALTAGTQSVLSANFVGFYLQGSFAIGGFDEHSDVDWIVVTETELSEREVRELQALHHRIYDLQSAWAQHLEGSYFPAAILRDHARRGSDLWYLDNGSRDLERSDHCNTLVVRWTVREHGLALAGPDPATLVDPVPVDALRGEIAAIMRTWGQEILDNPQRYANRFYQSFIVLFYCRGLHSLHTGTVESKRAGAEWAKATLDPAWHGLIDRTWAARPKPEVSVRQPADPEDFQRTLAFVRHVLEKEMEG